ncbi:MAG: carboxylesterase family protein, partial [Blastocatellia bacterium]
MRRERLGVIVFIGVIAISIAFLTASGLTRPSTRIVDAIRPIRVDGGLLAAAPADATGVRVFKGIPYAAPPVGQRRWQAPASVEAWSGVRSVERFGAPCMQTPLTGYSNSLAASD